MEHEPTRNPPPARFAPAVPATPNRAHWTPAKKRTFLHALLDTGSVAQAARAVGMSRSSAHRLCRRLAGTFFDRAWAEVLRLHAEQLAGPFGSNAAPNASEEGDDAASAGGDRW